jgi:hypothetical protein
LILLPTEVSAASLAGIFKPQFALQTPVLQLSYLYLMLLPVEAGGWLYGGLIGTAIQQYRDYKGADSSFHSSLLCAFALLSGIESAG